jgi:cytochrome c5
MKRTCLFVSVIVSTLLISCSKSNEAELGDTPGTGGNGNTCDTTGMTFSSDIKPILQNTCYGCHSNANSAAGSGVKLEDHADLKQHADDGDLLGAITHQAGFPAMPKGGAKLSECNINKIKAWVNRGAPNN